jgi:hypothetical protein
MTDPHDLDELASALLDGTTSPEEAARLAADPALRMRAAARAEELRAVRRALAELPPIDPARRDATISAALDAFDGPAVASAGATVTPLAPRRGLSPRAVRALGAAAVVLLLALLVPLLMSRDGADDEASFESTGAALGTTAPIELGQDDGGSAAPAEERSASDPGRAESGTASQTLGAFEDLDALAAAVASGDGRSADSAYDAGDVPRCEPSTTTDAAVLLASVDGTGVEVYVRTAGDGTRTMTVHDRDTCEVLDQREL